MEGTTDFTFTVPKGELDRTLKVINEEVVPVCNPKAIKTSTSVAKVSVVGIGMRTHAGVACKMFEALAREGINIQMINTSEIRVSVLLDEEDVNRAVRAIHDKFFGEI